MSEVSPLLGSSLLYSLAWTQECGPGQVPPSLQPLCSAGPQDPTCRLSNLLCCPGPLQEMDLDLAIEAARGVFGRLYPGQDFLPR